MIPKLIALHGNPKQVMLTSLVLVTGLNAHSQSLIELETDRILEKASIYLNAPAHTVTADSCNRSLGGIHDFYSEGDYWWQNPEDPEGPYIRRDGESNPHAFLAHRKSVMRLAEITATLASAYRITADPKFASATMTHLEAWFVDEATRMNPNLLYGQAIQGRHSGRSIGIIDTLQLIEVARAAKVIAGTPRIDAQAFVAVKQWFAEYLHWLNTHPYGLQEKKHPNNHGVCWSLQAAVFADLIDDKSMLEWVRNEFKTTYIAAMMAEDGSFPAELARTKPYGYSLFVVDAMSGIAQIASTEEENLWTFELTDGRGMRKALEFITPYIADKSTWPLTPDIQYWDEWPVRHCTLLFGAIAYENRHYLNIWKTLEPDPTTFETLRNFPIRHPLLWVNNLERTLP